MSIRRPKTFHFYESFLKHLSLHIFGGHGLNRLGKCEALFWLEKCEVVSCQLKLQAVNLLESFAQGAPGGTGRPMLSGSYQINVGAAKNGSVYLGIAGSARHSCNCRTPFLLTAFRSTERRG